MLYIDGIAYSSTSVRLSGNSTLRTKVLVHFIASIGIASGHIIFCRSFVSISGILQPVDRLVTCRKATEGCERQFSLQNLFMLICKYGCSRQFKTKAAMDSHRKASHPGPSAGPTAAKRIPCNDCAKTFISVHALQQHQLSKTYHTRPSNGIGSLGCDKCSRTLSNEALEKESHISSAAEKNQLQAQMSENRQLREALANQQVLLQQKEAEKIKLLRKHEEETLRLRLVEHAQKEALKLAKRQQIEMEREQLQTMLETGKLFHTIKGDFGHESKKMEELEKKLAELQSTQEFQEKTITTLAVKERESNDELVDGREMAVQVIQYINEANRLIEAALEKKGQLDKTKPQEINFTQPQPIVEVKRAGAIDETAWPRSFKRKYESDGNWGMKMTEVLSSWEARITNPEFQPFKTVQIGEDKWEQQIDDENEELASLKNTHGEDVYNSVTTALLEIEEYNASGRYPVPVAWNFKKSRKASLKEVIQYLGRIIDSLVAPEVLAHLGRTIESLMGPGASRKRSRN